MPTNIFKPCLNPISGETFQTISHDENAYVMKWTVQPKGYVPFEHIHLMQDEIFHVKRGEIKIFLDGKEHIARAGETITVPKGVAHIASNNREETLECIVEYKPGLDHEKMMQCLLGLTNDGYLDRKGVIHIPRMAYFLVRMKARCMSRPTSIPAPVFKLALRFFYLRGVLSGWSKQYEKYTGNSESQRSELAKTA